MWGSFSVLGHQKWSAAFQAVFCVCGMVNIAVVSSFKPCSRGAKRLACPISPFLQWHWDTCKNLPLYSASCRSNPYLKCFRILSHELSCFSDFYLHHVPVQCTISCINGTSCRCKSCNVFVFQLSISDKNLYILLSRGTPLGPISLVYQPKKLHVWKQILVS